MATTYLIVCDRSPYGTIAMQESFDLATAGAAFDFPVQVLLRGDAVYGALTTQNSETLGQKNAGKQLSALGIYGVDGIFVERAALTERSLKAQDLLPGVTVLDESDILSLLRDQSLVVQL